MERVICMAQQNDQTPNEKVERERGHGATVQRPGNAEFKRTGGNVIPNRFKSIESERR